MNHRKSFGYLRSAKSAVFRASLQRGPRRKIPRQNCRQQ
jgi:hypothetical protein